VVSSTDFHLDILDFRGVGLRFGDLLLLLFVVLEFTIIHDFCNWRGGGRRDFDKVSVPSLSLFECLLKGNNPEVFSGFGNDAQLRCFYKMIDADSWKTQGFKLFNN
jgi:hypothetical protein